MGLTHRKMEVASPLRLGKWEAAECLIDSGAGYPVIPTETLTARGVEPSIGQELRPDNGETVVRKKGVATFKYGDRVGGADVIFGEEGDTSLVGVPTLKALGLSLDPVKRRLRPLPVLLAGLGGDTP